MMMLAVAGMSMAFVACDKADESSGNKGDKENVDNEHAALVAHIDHLLALPEGMSEDDDHIHIVNKSLNELISSDCEVVVVSIFFFEGDLCVKAVSDMIFETVEHAEAYYNAMLAGEADMSVSEDELELLEQKDRLISINMTEVVGVAGATREDIRKMFNPGGEEVGLGVFELEVNITITEELFDMIDWSASEAYYINHDGTKVDISAEINTHNFSDMTICDLSTCPDRPEVKLYLDIKPIVECDVLDTAMDFTIFAEIKTNYVDPEGNRTSDIGYASIEKVYEGVTAFPSYMSPIDCGYFLFFNEGTGAWEQDYANGE